MPWSLAHLAGVAGAVFWDVTVIHCLSAHDSREFHLQRQDWICLRQTDSNKYIYLLYSDQFNTECQGFVKGAFIFSAITLNLSAKGTRLSQILLQQQKQLYQCCLLKRILLLLLPLFFILSYQNEILLIQLSWKVICLASLIFFCLCFALSDQSVVLPDSCCSRVRCCTWSPESGCTCCSRPLPLWHTPEIQRHHS